MNKEKRDSGNYQMIGQEKNNRGEGELPILRTINDTPEGFRRRSRDCVELVAASPVAELLELIAR